MCAGDQAPGFEIRPEIAGDVLAREALLDRALGARRRRKSSEKLRRGRLPSEGLAFSAVATDGRLVGTVRLWDVDAGGCKALLLGPLAVDPAFHGAGIGSALMNHAITQVRARGHKAVLLVGDAPYYQRFGFVSAPDTLFMPGPFERSRFLMLELQDGALADADGVLKAAGRSASSVRTARPKAA